jgi:hypothetical protein
VARLPESLREYLQERGRYGSAQNGLFIQLARGAAASRAQPHS